LASGRGCVARRETPARLSTRQTVEAGRPSTTESRAGPHPVRSRSSTIWASASGESRLGQCVAIGGRSRSAAHPPAAWRASRRYAVARLAPQIRAASAGATPSRISRTSRQRASHECRIRAGALLSLIRASGNSRSLSNPKTPARPAYLQPSRRLVGPTASPHRRSGRPCARLRRPDGPAWSCLGRRRDRP